MTRITVCLLGICACLQTGRSEPLAAPNIVLIMADILVNLEKKHR